MNRVESDHPGYSCERAPWALVTGVGPFDRKHCAGGMKMRQLDLCDSMYFI
jgi:hypothetical protein